MVNLCQKTTCYQGNCPGCKNGEKWCDDPKCTPYCTSCQPPISNDSVVNVLFATILIILLLGVFLSMFLYGPRFVVHHEGEYDPDHIEIEVKKIL